MQPALNPTDSSLSQAKFSQAGFDFPENHVLFVYMYCCMHVNISSVCVPSLKEKVKDVFSSDWVKPCFSPSYSLCPPKAPYINTCHPWQGVCQQVEERF